MASQMSRLGSPLRCALLGIDVFSVSLLGLDWLEEQDNPHVNKVRGDVFQMLVDAGADCKALYRDLNGKTFSCFEPAFYVDIEEELEHPISGLSTVGAPVDKQFLAALAEKLKLCVDQEGAKRLVNALRGRYGGR
jgi:hypothetical protein